MVRLARLGIHKRRNCFNLGHRSAVINHTAFGRQTTLSATGI
jgi:hypothetical protein